MNNVAENLVPVPDAQGIASDIDIYECRPGKIRNAGCTEKSVLNLCDAIEMKRLGKTRAGHFGEDEKVAGFAMVQRVETSLISHQFVQNHVNGSRPSLGVTFRV